MKTNAACQKAYRLIHLAIALTLSLGTLPTRAATVLWTNIAPSFWSVSTNWSPHVPGSTDTAIITNNGTVTLDLSPAVGSLILGALTNCGGGTLFMNGQTLTYSGQFVANPCGTLLFNNGGLLFGVGSATLGGSYSWSGGGLPFAGVVTLATNGMLNIVSGNNHDMPGIVFTNYGTVAWSGGQVRGGGTPGTFIYNYGTWDSQGDLTLNSDFQQQGLTFNNLGTFRKSAGTNVGTVFNPNASQAVLNNNGRVDVQTGWITLNGGAVLSGGSVTGSGVLYLNTGGFTLNGMVTTTSNVQFTGGSFVGTNTIIGGLTWNNGNWNNAPVVTLATNSELDIVSANNHDLANCVFTNRGRVEWFGGQVRGGSTPGTVIYNQGLWEAQCDSNVNSDYQQNGLIFNNAGTFRKIVTGGNTTFTPNSSSAAFNNLGVVDVQTGSVILNDGGTFSGGSVTGAGILYLNGGGFTINGTVTTLNVQFTGGSFVGVNTITNGLTWVNGTWDGATAVSLASNSELDIVSANNHDLYSCVFVNLGTVEWFAGQVRGGGTPGTTIYNMGLWEAQCDQNLNSDGQQDGLIFNNQGTFRKSVTTGNTSVNPNTAAALFNNSSGGLVDLQSGALVLNGGGSLTGGMITGAGLLYLNGGGFTLNGMYTTTTNAQFTAGSFVGANAIIGGLTWVNGNWNGAASVTVTTGSELDLVSGSNHDLFSCVFTNLGKVEWLAGQVRGGGTPGTFIYNLGLWEANCDQNLNSDAQQYGVVFNNLGTFRKSAATLSTVFNPNNATATFNNSGVIDIENGSLTLNGGGLFSGGSVTGTGPVNLNSGGFTINGTLTTLNVQLLGGGLVGTNVLRGGLTWVNGNWNGAPLVTVATNCELDIVSANNHDLANCLFTNLGKVEWFGGQVRGGSTPGTIVYNVNLWEAQCDQNFNSDYQQHGVIFNNLGTFRKLATTGSTSFNPNNAAASFNNAGLVDVETGAITLNAGGLFSAGSVTGSGVLNLNGGGFTVNGTVTTTNVVLTGGGLTGVNVLRGGFSWVNGTWNSAGPITLAAGGELDIVSANNHDLASCVFTNLGRVKWLGGQVRGGSTPGTVIHNLGLWDVFCDSAINSDYQQFGLVFNNYNVGTFRKSATTGTTAFNPNNAQATFNNLGGTIQLETGTFYLPQQNFSQNGGTLTIGLTGYTPGLWGELVVAPPYGAALSGPLNVILPNGPIYAVQDQYQIVSCATPLLTGQFSPVSLPPNLTLYYTTSGAFLWATNGPTRLISVQAANGQFQFGFFTAAGESYTVQQNTNLHTANWTYYTNFTGNGSLISVVAPASAPPQRYFRVRQP